MFFRDTDQKQEVQSTGRDEGARRHPLSEPFVRLPKLGWFYYVFFASNRSDLNHFQSKVAIVGIVVAAVFRLEKLLKCGCHSLLENGLGAWQAFSFSDHTFAFSFYLSNPSKQETKWSKVLRVMFGPLEFVYLRYHLVLNQRATDTKDSQPTRHWYQNSVLSSSRFGPDGRLVVPGMRPNVTRVLLAVALAATLQWARTPVFATPRARSGHMIRRRVGDELSSVLNVVQVQDPNFQAAV